MCSLSASLEAQWNLSSVPVHGLPSLLVDSQATSVCVHTLEIDPFCVEGFRDFPHHNSRPQLSHHSLCLHSFKDYGYLPSTYLFLLIYFFSQFLCCRNIFQKHKLSSLVGVGIEFPVIWMVLLPDNWNREKVITTWKKTQAQLLHFHVQVPTFCLFIIFTFIVKHLSY